MTTEAFGNTTPVTVTRSIHLDSEKHASPNVNTYGTRSTADGPWPRGEVIYAESGSMAPNRASTFNGYYRQPRGRGSLHRGKRKFHFPMHYDGPPATYLQNRRGYLRSHGMRCKWNTSMPQGLHFCGSSSPHPTGYMEDGFIDDTFASDLGQYSLQDSIQGRSSDQETLGTLDGLKVANEHKRTADHGDAYNLSKAMRNHVDISNSVASCAQIHPLLNGDGANTDEENKEELIHTPVYNGLKNLHTPMDYLTLVWGKSVLMN
ncbi:unnamed protein product [Dicrocoelium dendriticum]|nr:unnamed protein product [Dicrocoelium dendriticum]